VAAVGATVALGGAGAVDAIQAARAARGTVVIGKMLDITAEGALEPGERTLLDQLPDLGNEADNWAQNERVLLKEMSSGRPLRDASVNAETGALERNTGFLARERAVLTREGWNYDPSTDMGSGDVSAGVAVGRGRGACGAARAEGPVWSTAGQTDIRGLSPQDPVFVAARCLGSGAAGVPVAHSRVASLRATVVGLRVCLVAAPEASRAR